MQVSAVNDGGKGKKGKNKMTGDKGQGQGQRQKQAQEQCQQQEQGNETVGTVVNSKYISTVIAHIARSEDTNAQIVELGWYNRRLVQWLAFRTGAGG